MTGSKHNYKAFFAALQASQAAGNPNTKEEAVLDFTAGRTSSLSDLSKDELSELVNRLNATSGFKPDKKWFTGKEQKMRMAFFPLAYEMGWGEPYGEFKEKQKAAAARLDVWSKKQKYKKGFNELDKSELGVLLTIFKEQVYKSFMAGLNGH